MSTVDVTRAEQGAPPSGRDGAKRRGRITANKAFQASLAFLAFLGIFIFFGFWLGDAFVSAPARILDIHQNAAVLMLGFAVLVSLIAGQFDLSVASMATLSTFLTVGLTVNQSWPFALVLLFCLFVGAVGGLINGLLVVRVRVNAFIATLGTGGVYLGISSVYSEGTQITPGVGNSQTLPTWFAGPESFGAVGTTVPSVLVWAGFACVLVGFFFSLRRLTIGGPPSRKRDLIIGGLIAVAAAILIGPLNLGDWVDHVSLSVALLLFVGLLLWILLAFTTYGRYLRATGSNAVAARLAGVDTGGVTIRAFVLGGLLAALAGIVLAANQGAASPNIATAYLLPAFAAAFLSTVVLSNGRFEVWGTLVGGVFLIWVSQGLIVGGLSFTWTEIVQGLVLIGAVSLSTVFRRESVK